MKMDNKSPSSVSSMSDIKDILENVISVRFDKKLLDTLRARHNSRYSRSEAFIDILLRMRHIDNGSADSTTKQSSTELMQSSNTLKHSVSVQQPSLFPEQDRQANDGFSASDAQSPSYSGKPTDEFMSRHCITNYSQLANAWHWNRQTVLTFLRSLESDGVLLFEQKNKSVEIFI